MTSPIRLQAVVFDLDGLMFNTEDLYDLVGDELLRPLGHRFTPDVKRKMMGRPGAQALAIMIEHFGLASTPDALQRESDLVFDRILPSQLNPMPGLLTLLDSLAQANLPCGVATSSRRRFVDQVLAQYDLASRFQFILTAEDVRSGKPDPEIYRTAANRHGTLPGEMLVLEDSENGCRAAIAAGAHVVAVPNRHTVDHDFTGVAHIAASLSDPYIYDAIGLQPPR